MTIELSITKQFEYLLPKLTKDERKALEESLLKEGCRNPIVSWRGTIIDGHNRYSICKKHNIPFNVKEMDDLLDEDAVKMWMVNNQLGRRNLTDEQRERFIGILHNTSKKGQGGARDRSGRKSKAQIEPLKNAALKEGDGTADTAEMIAKQHGVSRETVKRAGKYALAVDRISKVSPAAEAKIMSGEARRLVNKSDIRDLAEASEAEIQKVVEAIEKDKPVTSVKKAQTTEKTSLVRQVYKVIYEIESRTDILTDMMGRLATGLHGEFKDEDRDEIANRVDNVLAKMGLIGQNFL
jgi:mRNA-degrading endonuclease RelE of RelBE toxin-antitoxin system